MINPFAIVQARIRSTRLPGKMLLPLAGKPLIWHAWNAAVQAFGPENVVVAIPASAENDELGGVCEGFGATVFRWDGPEDDVLGRFYYCAHAHRWHPDSVIVRVSPDDPFKDPAMMRRVANGERLPVEQGAEAFTLAQLDAAPHRWYTRVPEREHITRAIFPTDPPPCPVGVWTVDTEADLLAARAREADSMKNEAAKAKMEAHPRRNLPPLGDISSWLKPSCAGEAGAPLRDLHRQTSESMRALRRASVRLAEAFARYKAARGELS